MASTHRQGEARLWSKFVAELGFETLTLAEGVWEGQGDVAEFRGVTLLLYGGRTNWVGLRAARTHLDGEVMELQVREPAFHGNMALLPLPVVNKLLVCAEVFVADALEQLRRRFGADALLPVSVEEICRYATNGLPILDSWMPSITPTRVKDMVTQLGMRVVVLDMAELCEKAGGASRCLVCRVPSALVAGLR